MSQEIDDSWRTEARATAVRLFPNQGLQPVAQLLVSAHRYAVQYIEQAPVIVLAAARGQNPRRHNERAYLTGQIGEMSRRGDRLRDVMKAYGLPLPLRSLKGTALGPSKWPIIFRLARLNPSTLAQIIPESVGAQMAWLRALDEWLARMSRRNPSEPGLFFEWAAVAYSGISHRETHVAESMADFALSNRDTFNTRWTREQAENAENAWHMKLARRSEAAKQMEAAGVGFDTPIDYAPLPTAVEISGFSFTALQSGESLFAEGAAMRHCVASYIRSVVTGTSRIYSIRQNGRRVATLELAPIDSKKVPRRVINECGDEIIVNQYIPGRYAIRQLKGPCNALPLKRVREAAALFEVSVMPSP